MFRASYNTFLYIRIVSWDDTRLKRDGQTDGRLCHHIIPFWSTGEIRHNNLFVECRFHYVEHNDIDKPTNGYYAIAFTADID